MKNVSDIISAMADKIEENKECIRDVKFNLNLQRRFLKRLGDDKQYKFYRTRVRFARILLLKNLRDEYKLLATLSEMRHWLKNDICVNCESDSQILKALGLRVMQDIVPKFIRCKTIKLRDFIICRITRVRKIW